MLLYFKFIFSVSLFCLVLSLILTLTVLLINVISRSSNSPESGIGNSHLSLGALGEHFQDIDGDDEFFDPEPLPVLGKCKAIYPFEGV